ncbi:MAG TPA: hydrogenase 4 subunit F [Dehalococcoidia bacterium]|nr:hydrogenase 4 subunit F [Dehalococcoidia bacterium]
MIALAVGCLILAPLAAAVLIQVPPLRKGAGPLALFAAVMTLTAALAIAVQVQSDGPQSAFGDWVYIDSLSVVILVLIAIVGVCATLNSLPYINRDIADGHLRAADGPRYYSLLMVFMATMVVVPVINNLGGMWVAIEATTVVSVLLVSIYRTGQSLEAAWKYLVLGSVGIALALFGTMMTYYASSPLLGDSSHGLSWTDLQAISSQLDPDVMRLAFVFVLVGYGTKVGLAPMHTWLPDAHSQAPSPVSALLSGVLLNCALYAVLRFRVLTAGSAGDAYADDLLIAFGLFSVGLAVPFLVVQHDIKRMLAYHSVEHMGIIALAVGIGGPVALYAAMLHLVAHSLTKSSLFMAAGSVVQAFNTRSMHRMRGVLALAPFSGASLILGAVALAGLPPFAMFTSEYGLVSGSFTAGHALIGVAGLLLIALAAASILYHTVQVSYGQPRAGQSVPRLGAAALLSVALPLVLLLFISVAPPAEFESALRDAATVIEGG